MLCRLRIFLEKKDPSEAVKQIQKLMESDDFTIEHLKVIGMSLCVLYPLYKLSVQYGVQRLMLSCCEMYETCTLRAYSWYAKRAWLLGCQPWPRRPFSSCWLQRHSTSTLYQGKKLPYCRALSRSRWMVRHVLLHALR